MKKTSTAHNEKSNVLKLILIGIALIGAFFITLTAVSGDVPRLSELLPAAVGSCKDSSLWSSTDGYDPERLTDFSRAGYMAGEEAIPNDPAQRNIKTDFGAKGDGTTDDTKAFQNAVTQASGVIFIPEGEYVITEPIRILKDNVVLRGSGTDKTILKFTQSLTSYCNYKKSEAPDYESLRWDDQTCKDEVENTNKPFSHNRGFIQFGDDSSGKLKGDRKNSPVLENADRGEKTLVINNARGLSVGQWIILEMHGDPTKNINLMNRLQGGKAAGVTNSSIENESPRFLNKIVAINGNTLTLALPLTIDVRKAWTPTVSQLETTVSNVGIEKLKIVFPFEEYQGHFKEKGFNAIHFSSVKNCWASQVTIINSDNPINLVRSAFCTLDRVKFNDAITFENDKESAKKLVKSIKRKWKSSVPSAWYNKKAIRGEYSGHHGINLANSFHVLVTDSKFLNRFVHDISATSYSNRNVFSNITGFDLTLDHHRRAPHNNLYTDIETGLGTHIWKSSGVCRSDDDCFGPHSGAYNTYWNITRADGTRSVPLPINNFDNKSDGQDFGLKLNFVFDVNGTKKSVKDRWGWHVEDKNKLCTPNLYEAMVQYKDNVEKKAIANGEDPEPANIF